MPAHLSYKYMSLPVFHRPTARACECNVHWAMILIVGSGMALHPLGLFMKPGLLCSQIATFCTNLCMLFELCSVLVYIVYVYIHVCTFTHR